MLHRLQEPIGCFLCLLCLAPTGVWAARPTVKDALGLAPVQSDADVDVPAEAEIEKCELAIEKFAGGQGWVVRDGDGRLLRRFLDTNQDQKVDRWCYFKNGVEVYRDLDTDFDGKADQYRWLGTAGVRWGLDADEDGVIDSWKQISAEEVSEEAVAALARRDAARFQRLLLTEDELDQLGLGKEHAEQLRKRLQEARQKFPQLAANQDTVTERSTWIHFGASRPNLLPAGMHGAEKDVVLYDNVAAVIETDGKHSQVAIGSIIRVGDRWRLTGLPAALLEGLANQPAPGFFFGDGLPVAGPAEQPPAGMTAELQQLIGELEEIDQQLTGTASAANLAQLNARRADVLRKLATQAKGTPEYENWIRQLADTVSAAVQAGQFAEGVGRLQQLEDQLREEKADTSLLAYVRFRYLSAEYGASLQKPDADFAKVQEDWLKRLETFVEQYPDSDDAAEAMLQVAIAKEFAGEDQAALNWYGRIVSEFAENSLAAKAAGAKRRLESVGKTISLQGTTTDGQAVNLSAFRGRTVVLHYWATWCEPCKQDIRLLKELQTKYARNQLAVVGVNLDTDTQAVRKYLASNPLGWPQVREPEGLDGRLANEMGVVTLPTMLLIDADGKVVNRNIHSSQLDEELGKLLK